MNHEVAVCYYDPVLRKLVEASASISIPRDARIEGVRLIPAEDPNIIRVSFGAPNREYNYRCDAGVQVGDWVIVPPNEVVDNYQVVQVVGKGGSPRSGYHASRHAARLPRGTRLP